MDRSLAINVKFAALDKLTRPIRDITGSTAKLAAGMKAARTEQRELQRTQRDTSSYRKTQAALAANHDQLDQVRRKMRALRSEIESTDGKTGRLTVALGAAERAERRLIDTTGRQSSEIRELATRLERAGVEVRDLARHEDRLADSLRKVNTRYAEQRAQLGRVHAVQQQSQRLQMAGQNMSSAGASLLIGGAVAGAPLVIAIKEASEFRSSMTDIAIKANLSDEAAERMGRKIQALAPKVSQLPEVLQGGIDKMLGFGLATDQAMAMIGPIGRAASATKATVEDLSAATYAAVANLKVPARETTRILDTMSRLGEEGGFELAEMAAHFPALTASAQALGQKGVPAVADLAAALQIARTGAGDGATAANNIQNLLNKINAKDTVDNFKKMGVDLPNALKRAYADGKTPLEAIAELTQKATGGNLAKLSYLFGDAQAQAALRSLVQNMDQYRRLRETGMNSQGDVAADYGRRERSGELAPVKYEAEMSRLKEIAGSKLLPTINILLDKLGTVITKVNDWADAHPAVATGMLQVAAAFVAGSIALGALLTVFGPFVTVAKGLPGLAKGIKDGWGWLGKKLPLIVPLFAKVGNAMLWLAMRVAPLLMNGIYMLARGIAAASTMMLANPMVLAIVAIIAVLAFAGYMIWKHWDTIKAAFWAAIAWLGVAWTNIKATFASAAAWFVGLPGRFNQFGANIITGLIDGLLGKLALLKSKMLGVARSVASWFKSALGINSPSRVFMGFGGHLTEGLAIGVKRGGDEPVRRIRDLSNRVTGALAIGAAAMSSPALASGGAARSASQVAAAGPTYITINVQQLPGQSGADLARQIAAELDRRDRAVGAARRSSYEDDA